MELKTKESRASDPARIATMDVLNRDLLSFQISAAEDQITEDADGLVEVLDSNSGESQTAKDAILVKLLSSLCQKIDKLGEGLSEDKQYGNQHVSATRGDRFQQKYPSPFQDEYSYDGRHHHLDCGSSPCTGSR